MNDVPNKSHAANNKIDKNKATTSISFEYKTNVIGITSVNINRLDVELLLH